MNEIKQLKGPILIFGAGGFIGINLVKILTDVRQDVFGVFTNPQENWRLLVGGIPKQAIRQADITKKRELYRLLKDIKPQTVFNLVAYGAYARQKNVEKIYTTNVTATMLLIEALKKQGFIAYIHAGSQSEYGLNATTPKENDELMPNSHYAVSKVANAYSVKYYGKIENLPVVQLRLYSAYGPFEEPDRLLPALIAAGRHKSYPRLAAADTSRDFVYVTDIVQAFILAAAKMHPNIYGECFNVATGKKTTIKELALLSKRVFHIPNSPSFDNSANRAWDVKDWYGDSGKIATVLGWKPQVTLEKGLLLTAEWQEKVKYEQLITKWKKKL